MNWYWLIFVAATILWLAVPVVAWLERRADRRDRARWARMYGMRR